QGIDILRAQGVTELVLAGGVRRPSLLALRPDLRTAKFVAKIGMRALGDDGLLRAIVAELEGEGFRVVGADTILNAALARGVTAARALGALDIGQAVVVQQGVVLGVEGTEGTDALVARCASLALDGPGGVLVKMAKPEQERRADLPTIGPDTVVRAADASLRGIAVEAGAALILDRAETIAAADARGLFIVGVPAP